ncbi:hypothetical protein ROHU_014493 [Labeo rohita]|uniref:Uncharacterized protein n=1 Tax=Labeo rohita TaxID=84645 RepID=A0A498NUN5_LABRO|nr:hypothetical protein ROHU_014493 [Labeo rohita]
MNDDASKAIRKCSLHIKAIDKPPVIFCHRKYVVDLRLALNYAEKPNNGSLVIRGPGCYLQPVSERKSPLDICHQCLPALIPRRWHSELVLSYSRASQNHHPTVIPGTGCSIQWGESEGTLK